MDEKKFKFPTAYTTLAIVVVLIAVLTWIIPAGQYELDDEGSPIPGSYHEVEANPQGFGDILMAPINGMYGIEDEESTISVWNVGALFGAIDVALFVLIIGGFLGVTMKTGAIDAGIAALTRSMEGKERLLIPSLMFVFSLGGTTYGMAEETLAFYALVVGVMVAAGYDALVGVSVVLLGAGVGVLGSTVNPFATGIASGFADTPLGEGIVLRLLIWLIGLALAIWWVQRYASRVKADSSKSMVADSRAEIEQSLGKGDSEEFPELTSKRKLVLALFGLTFLVMVYAVIPWGDLGLTMIPELGWWFPELTALFLLGAIVIGLVARMGDEQLTSSFVDGARDMLGVALIIAMARGVTVLMTNGLITDTILAWAENLLSGVASVVFINLVFWIEVVLSFLIPSSSGLATMTMPILSPLADFAGVGRDVVVTAYQSASGWVNLITPTSAVVMGGLAIGRVGYGTWLRFTAPLMAALAVMVMILLSIGVLLGG
jgi:uncharacterized ion transporter superfamily protein YfcC